MDFSSREGRPRSAGAFRLSEYKGRFFLVSLDNQEQRVAKRTTAADPISFTIDPAGQIISWTIGAENLFNCAACDALGKHFYRFCDLGFVVDGSFERALNQAISTGCAENERWFVRGDGIRFYGNERIEPILADGDFVKGYSVAIRAYRADGVR